jgi:hypothetical protein
VASASGEPIHDEYDVIVIGGGPRVASAVYGASEVFARCSSNARRAADRPVLPRASRTISASPSGSRRQLSGRARRQATFRGGLLVTRWTDSLDLACESGESSHVVTLDGGNVVSTTRPRVGDRRPVASAGLQASIDSSGTARSTELPSPGSRKSSQWAGLSRRRW